MHHAFRTTKSPSQPAGPKARSQASPGRCPALPWTEECRAVGATQLNKRKRDFQAAIETKIIEIHSSERPQGLPQQ